MTCALFSSLPLLSQAAAGGDFGAILLRNQLKELIKNPVDGFSVGLVDDSDIFEWQVIIEGPPGTLFEGGLFPAVLKFPKEYPNRPPEMRFTTPNFWHPNGLCARVSLPFLLFCWGYFLHASNPFSTKFWRISIDRSLCRRQSVHFHSPRGQGGCI